MEATPRVRPARSLHRTYTQRVPAPVVEAGPPVRTWLVQSAWLGLASGWLEAGVWGAHRCWIGTVTNQSVRLNRYHVPLGMLAQLATFAAAAALAAALANRRAARWWRDPLVSSLGWFVALASPLLALEELHPLSGLLLAAGTAAALGPRWVRWRAAILRRTFGPLAVASGVLVIGGFAWVGSAEDRARAALPPARPGAPNVVLLVLDTVRADHLGLYGYGRPTTPVLDSLAARAVRFDLARSPAPWTLPSHASMFTGRWPHELSVDYDRPLDGTHPTLAEHLARQGYATGGFVGNTVYCNSWFGVDRGFARYEDAHENRAISALEMFRSSALTRELIPLGVRAGIWASDGRFSPRKPAEQVNRDALAWLDAGGRGDRPFFLFLNYIDAHGPYTLPDHFPRSFSKANRGELIAANRRANNKGLPDAERFAAIEQLGIDAYDDCIRYIDAQIGHLLAELDRRDKRRDTWVIVTADHGEHFGEHGLFIHGNSLHRPLVDVPLLIIPPDGAAARRVVTDPVSLRDLPATVADLVGPGGEAAFPGHSLRHHWDARLAAPARVDRPLSEWKIPAGTKGLDGLPEHDQVRTAVVDRGRIYHRDPLGAEALFRVEDEHEAIDLAPNPGEQAALEALRDLEAELRRGER